MKVKALLETGLLLTVIFCGVFMLLKTVRLGFCSSRVIVVPDDYLKISWAVGNASDGDTIFVRLGNYSEWDITVNKTVKIVGESAENTVLDGGGVAWHILQVIADNVVVENFTLQNIDVTRPGPAAVRVFNVQNVTVESIMTRNVASGVEVYSSNFTKIMFCISSESFNGVYLHYGSCNNTIAVNTIENNSNGIFIADTTCQFNRIYHNNFINNTRQISTVGGYNYFDNGYPSGGNYWSDYAGVDEFGGPYQNVTGSDGIFDERHFGDNYPLANPLISFSVLVGEQTFLVQASTNVTVKTCSFNISKKALDLFVSGPFNSVGACRVAIPQELLSCENLSGWVISIYYGDGEWQTLPYLPKNDTESTYLFFVYNHRTADGKIEIKGTKAIPELNVVGLAVLFMTTSLIFTVTEKLRCKKNRISRYQRCLQDLS